MTLSPNPGAGRGGGEGDRVEAAARRAGADRKVWDAAHHLHLDRGRVIVRRYGEREVAGYIVGLDDLGFTLDGNVRLLWVEVYSVERLR